MYVYPVADNSDYHSSLLTQFNEMFPVGTTLSFVNEADPPIKREMCQACLPEAIRLTQQLMVTTPEFHTTANGDSDTDSDNSGKLRIGTKARSASSHPFKAIVYIFLSGGPDSYNVLVPYSGCKSDMYSQYRTIRDNIAISKEELLPIDANPISNRSQQVCTRFGLYPEYQNLARIFNGGDAMFVANTGNLIEPIASKYEYWRGTKRKPPQTFNHVWATHFAQTLDPTSKARKDGVLGRMMLALEDEGLNTQSYSIAGHSVVLTTPDMRSGSKYKVINGQSLRTTTAYEPLLPEVRNMTAYIENAPLAEAWSSELNASLEEVAAGAFGSILADTTLVESWTPTHASSLSRQLKQVATILKAKADGKLTDDRQAFYVHFGNFDGHSGDLLQKLKYVDSALGSFEKELKSNGMWDKVTLVQASDMGRTLRSNGDGTDHGWGGNYWVAGGSVQGGQVIGEYPDDLGGELDSGGGRMIPSTSWDMVWNGLSEWMGVPEHAMGDVIPNRGNFPNLFRRTDMFKASQ